MLTKNFKVLFYLLAVAVVFGCNKGSSTLDEQPSPPKPIADFTYEISTLAPPKVNFTNKSQFGDTYKWVFSSNIISLDKNPPQINFVHYGKHNVKLTVKNLYGESNVTKEIDFPIPFSKAIIKEVVITSITQAYKFDPTSNPDVYITVTGGASGLVNTAGIAQYNDWPLNQSAYFTMQGGYNITNFDNPCVIKIYDADDPSGGDPDDLMGTYNLLANQYTTAPHYFPTTVTFSASGIYGYVSLEWQ